MIKQVRALARTTAVARGSLVLEDGAQTQSRLRKKAMPKLVISTWIAIALVSATAMGIAMVMAFHG